MAHSSPSKRTALLALGLLATASPALAVDLTGTYEGVQKVYTLISGGAEDQVKSESTLEITQDGDFIAISFDGLTYNGYVIEHPGKPEKKGLSLMVACGTDDDPDTDDSMALLQGKADAESGKGKVKLESFAANALGIEVRRAKWARVSTEDPGVVGCVAP